MDSLIPSLSISGLAGLLPPRNLWADVGTSIRTLSVVLPTAPSRLGRWRSGQRAEIERFGGDKMVSFRDWTRVQLSDDRTGHGAVTRWHRRAIMNGWQEICSSPSTSAYPCPLRTAASSDSQGRRLVRLGPGRRSMVFLTIMGPETIVDLCHFGVQPGSATQNTDVPEALAGYAEPFARASPGSFYTPVNEMYVCARMSALDGTWNEQRATKRLLQGQSSISPRASIA